MFLIGLTGGIASGKSTVARFLAAHGAEVIDADQVARDVVVPGSEGLRSIVAEFGSDVLAQDGSLARDFLAQIVFNSPAKRLILESILHPLIKERTNQLIQSSKSKVLVYAVPLLVEAGVDYPFDMVITVEANPDIQMERLVTGRGLTSEQAKARLDSQVSESERVAKADVRLDSSGELSKLREQVDKLWVQIQARLSESGTSGAN